MLNNDILKQPALYPTYPPYHTGSYLEEYFYNWYCKNKVNTNKNYIDVFWTNLYCNAASKKAPPVDIQSHINKLDPTKEYFTVCQHDDGPLESLPPNTLIFSAGGNRTHGNIIPIPLICSPIIDHFINETKTIFCSFVGSRTHTIRQQLTEQWNNDEDFIFASQGWQESVPKKNLTIFKTLTIKSKFTLCPRGYGKSSFRMYEAIQLGSVPVYISDSHYLPWSDELDWSEFCILITPDQISDLKNILSSYSDDKINGMVKRGQEIYNSYFSLEGMCKQIAYRLL